VLRTGVAVEVAVGVSVNVGVFVEVGVAVSVGVAVEVALGISVAVGVSVEVAVGIGVSVGVNPSAPLRTSVAVRVSVGTPASETIGWGTDVLGPQAPIPIALRMITISTTSPSFFLMLLSQLSSLLHPLYCNSGAIAVQTAQIP
jgi:hypothetical protein